MKIMIVGAWEWPQYEEAFATGLRNNDVDVIRCESKQFFRGAIGRRLSAIPVPSSALWRLNRHVLELVEKYTPDWVLFWRPTHILPGTVRRLNSLGVRTVSYNNDDPFGPQAHGNVPWHHHFLWHWYLKSLPFFERNFFYRRVNCDEARAYGASHAEVLMPYFLPWRDRPVTLDKRERAKFETDVVFVGHYEADGRTACLQALVKARIDLKIWGGPYWTKDVLGDIFEYLAPISAADGHDYARALCGAKVCLAFLSKINRDTYTRRCFEIPACGRVMLAERTADLQRIYKEDEEACFFSTNDELVTKVRWLLENPECRERIAAAGLNRVWADGGDVSSRVEGFLAGIA